MLYMRATGDHGRSVGRAMYIVNILGRLVHGTTLEGPFFTESVKVLAAKARGSRINVQAVGLHTKQLWIKLLKAEDFDTRIRITQTAQVSALDDDQTPRFK